MVPQLSDIHIRSTMPSGQSERDTLLYFSTICDVSLVHVGGERFLADFPRSFALIRVNPCGGSIDMKKMRAVSRLSIVLLACVQAVAGRAAQPSPPFPGILGLPMAEALKTDFFTFFHMVETSRQTAGASTIVTFKPSGADFRQLLTLQATVTDQQVVGLRLELARKFISGSQGVFANDIAKSFLADGPPRADRTALELLVNEIQSNRNAGTLVLRGKETPPVPARESDGYLAYLDRKQAYSQKLTACSLHMENVKQNDEEWLQIQLTPTR
jgi:hypothetical protein